MRGLPCLNLCLVRPRVDLQFNANSAKLLLLGARHHDSRVKALRGGEAPELLHPADVELRAATAVEDRAQNIVNFTFDVSFHYGPLVTHPLNLGSMPTIGLDTSEVVGLQGKETQVIKKGEPPTNFSFPEQLIYKPEGKSLTELYTAAKAALTEIGRAHV